MRQDRQLRSLLYLIHLSIPARAGVGLKPDHYDTIIDTWPDIGWFEVHPENYLCDGGVQHFNLTRIRACYPLSFHGVGLSVGSAGPLDRLHLGRIAKLVRRYEPSVFSEHLAWSSHDGEYLNDLLPLHYARKTLNTVCRHIDEIQSELQRSMLLENPSTYVTFLNSEMSETDFLSEVARRTGCGLLLDVNNVYVSATNNGSDLTAFVVGAIHGKRDKANFERGGPKSQGTRD